MKQLLSDMVSGTLGSFIVTKIINAAFRRVSIPEEKRVPWYLYVDEFQAFMDLSIGFDRICNETRKFKLVLAGLANQYVGQLSPQVRQSVFGNVGTLITFRMGVEDVNAVARHMRGFTGEEISSLTVGEALVHIDDPDTTFNLKTYPPPPTKTPSPADEIVKLARKRYSTPRAEVEARLGIRQRQPDEGGETNTTSHPEMNDPNEDDLVK